MDIDEKQDLEASKRAAHNHTSETSVHINNDFVDETYEVKPARELQEHNGFFRKLRAGEEWLASAKVY